MITMTEKEREDELLIVQQLFDNVDCLKEQCAILQTQRDIARNKLKNWENWYMVNMIEREYAEGGPVAGFLN